jgi:hypothetical protein
MHAPSIYAMTRSHLGHLMAQVDTGVDFSLGVASPLK